jgi:kynurenine formamidase
MEFKSIYGKDDQLGAVNNLSPAGVIEAAALIKQGKVYSLAITTGPSSPAYGPRNYQIFITPIYVGNRSMYGKNQLQGYDDAIVSYLGVGTHIDGFAHVAVNGRHYNGAKTEDVIRPDGAIKYGIDTVPPIVGRGVLLDMAGAAGVAMLPGGTVFNRKELEAVQKREDIQIRKGDVVLINTGWLSMQEADRKTGFSTTPGLGEEGAEYLAELGVVAVGQDAWIPDAMPAEDPTNFLPVHSILLVKHGVHILENIKTEDLAADMAYEFFFILAAPRFKGSLQGVMHPVAIR